MVQTEDVQLEELVPVAAELYSVEKVGVFGDNAEMKPATASKGFLTRVIVHVASTDLDTSSLASVLTFIGDLAKVEDAVTLISEDVGALLLVGFLG